MGSALRLNAKSKDLRDKLGGESCLIGWKLNLAYMQTILYLIKMALKEGKGKVAEQKIKI